MDLCINMEALREALIKEINNSNLTIGAATFIVKDIYNTLYLMFLEEKQKELTGQNEHTETKTIDFAVSTEEERPVEDILE